MNPEDQVRSQPPDIIAYNALKRVQKLPKVRFAEKATSSMQPGLNKTAASTLLGAAEGVVNAPSDLITGSSTIGEQLGNAVTGNPIDWSQGLQGGKELASSFVSALPVQAMMNPLSNEAMTARFLKEANPTSEGLFKNAAGKLYDPLTGTFAHTDDVSPEALVRQIPQQTRNIPIKQGGNQIGNIDMGRSFGDYDPKFLKSLLKKNPYTMVGG